MFMNLSSNILSLFSIRSSSSNPNWLGAEFEEGNSAGVDRGKKYTVRVKNILPDHLAILTTDVGACSVADGCGLFQNFQNRALLKQDQRDEDILQPVNIGGGITEGRWW